MGTTGIYAPLNPRSTVDIGRMKVVKTSTHDNVGELLTEPLNYYGRVETMQTPLYRYLIADCESEDIKEQEMPEPEPPDGDEPHFYAFTTCST